MKCYNNRGPRRKSHHRTRKSYSKTLWWCRRDRWRIQLRGIGCLSQFLQNRLWILRWSRSKIIISSQLVNHLRKSHKTAKDPKLQLENQLSQYYYTQTKEEKEPKRSWRLSFWKRCKRKNKRRRREPDYWGTQWPEEAPKGKKILMDFSKSRLSSWTTNINRLILAKTVN